MPQKPKLCLARNDLLPKLESEETARLGHQGVVLFYVSLPRISKKKKLFYNISFYIFTASLKRGTNISSDLSYFTFLESLLLPSSVVFFPKEREKSFFFLGKRKKKVLKTKYSLRSEAFKSRIIYLERCFQNKFDNLNVFE
jgi:hypothetical protein